MTGGDVVSPVAGGVAGRRGREAGEQGAEASWILEDNEPMNRAMTAMDTRIYRRWRVYDRAIGGRREGADVV
jgi:hypothetical protein